MESIITQLTDQGAWEEFLAYRLMKGRFNWHEFDEADTFVAEERYLQRAQELQQGGCLGLPTKKMVNKMGAGKKRVVYSYGNEEMEMLKLIAHLLYRYDDCFAPNCYAFRRGLTAHNAIFRLNKAIQGKKMWAYKLDIHDYFNSIPVELLLPILRKMLADDPPLYLFFERMLTDHHVIYNGQVIEEPHGIMAGTPTAPFLANVFLSDIDHHFYKEGVVYARYSDDIILFAPDQESLERHKAALLQFLKDHRLEVNPDKERYFTPEEPYEFLGFKCHGRQIDIAESTKNKMKGKIRRQAHALMRWRSRKDLPPEAAMKAMIRYFNQKFFESDDPETLTWSRWFFPVITQSKGLREIDQYLQQNIRFLATGRHGKANYRTSYEQLKQLGYRSLVHEFYS